MKLVIYRTKIGPQRGYRWTLVADNGRKLANGGQGYSRRVDMERAISLALCGFFSPSEKSLFWRGAGDNPIPVEDRTR